MMRALVAAALVVGCEYPEFTFVAPEAGDSSVVVEDTFVPEDDTSFDTALDSADVPAPETAATPERSCKDIRSKAPDTKSGTFTIDPDGDGPIAPFRVYCEMTADGGGWTLALKADGAKSTFAYDSPLWTNEDLLNEASADLSTAEAKLRSYTSMSFTQFRVRMFDGTTPRFFVISHAASSMRAMFAGPAVTTTAGRAKWLSLLADPSLQDNCNAEGINLQITTSNMIRLRVGIVGNNETNCDTPNSYIGFGASMGDPSICYGGVDPGVVVGNAARTSCGASKDKSTRTVGYLFVR